MRARLAVLIVSVAALGVFTSTAAGSPVAGESGKKPLLIANCAKPKFEPKNVIIACGDASFGARGMTWSTWTQKQAVGTGTGQINDCDPDCVHGTTESAPIELRLSKPQRCKNGVRLFSKLHYTWTAGAPAGPASGSVPFGCKLLAI